MSSLEENWPAACGCRISSRHRRRSMADEVGKQYDCRTCFGWICRGFNRRRRIPGDDVVRRIERGVDPAPPNRPVVVVELWKLEIQRIPIGIEDEVKQAILVQRFHGDCQTMRGWAPVRLI